MGKDAIKPFYDVLIVGGGIVGCGAFRDLNLHGVSTLLIDRGDFASQTSQSSSKMLHGGIRYLENLDFHLVFEALHEKNLWLKMAPHLCYEKPFHMPIYKESKYPLWTYRIGLNLYDFLSQYQNSPHKVYSKDEVLKVIPDLKSEGMTGAGVYYDAIVDDSKMALECLYDGLLNEDSDAHNYIEIMNVQKIHHGFECELFDHMLKKSFKVKCNEIIFATGPFTDALFPKLKLNHWESHLAPSKGIHLWLKKSAIKIHEPAILQTKDNRVIFVIPQRESILIGTTETKPIEDYFNIKANQSDIDYIFSNIKYFFPDANLNYDQILSTFAGVRPLVKENANSTLSKISREHKNFHPFSTMHVILGGKYTTFRTMVQSTVELICTRRHISYNPNKTLNNLRRHSVIPTYQTINLTHEHIYKVIKNEKVKTFEDLMRRRMSLPNANHFNEVYKNLNFLDFFNPIMNDLSQNIVVPENWDQIILNT